MRDPPYPLHYASFGWTREVFSYFRYDFWGVGGDVWRRLCRHVCRKKFWLCRWGAERRVKRAQTRLRGHPSYQWNFRIMVFFWVGGLAFFYSFISIIFRLFAGLLLPRQIILVYVKYGLMSMLKLFHYFYFYLLKYSSAMWCWRVEYSTNYCLHRRKILYQWLKKIQHCYSK